MSECIIIASREVPTSQGATACFLCILPRRTVTEQSWGRRAPLRISDASETRSWSTPATRIARKYQPLSSFLDSLSNFRKQVEAGSNCTASGAAAALFSVLHCALGHCDCLSLLLATVNHD